MTIENLHPILTGYKALIVGVANETQSSMVLPWQWIFRFTPSSAGQACCAVDDGTMFAMTTHGARKVVPNCNVMGPFKAALVASCRFWLTNSGRKAFALIRFPRPAQNLCGFRTQGF